MFDGVFFEILELSLEGKQYIFQSQEYQIAIAKFGNLQLSIFDLMI